MLPRAIGVYYVTAKELTKFIGTYNSVNDVRWTCEDKDFNEGPS